MSERPSSHAKEQCGIPADSIQGQLEKILAGKDFVNAPQRSGLLQFIVDYTLQNGGKGPKESIIGIDFFGIKDFDPLVHTNVRKAASELRRRLKQYYETEGRNDPVLMELPAGGFTPTFTERRVPWWTRIGWWLVRLVFVVPESRRKWLWAGGGTIVVLALAGWMAWGRIQELVTGIPREKHIAVLPFTNVDSDPANQAFCLGILVELTGKLSELERFQQSLWVIPASDVLESGVRSAEKALRTFGANLFVTGSVQRASRKLRLRVNLIGAKNLKQLRSKEITTEMGESFAMQDEAIKLVTQMLDVALQPQAGSIVRAGVPAEPSAEDFYLEGRGYLQRGVEGLDHAIALFHEALERDSEYALALAALGEAYLQKYELIKDLRWIEPPAGGTRWSRPDDQLLHHLVPLPARAEIAGTATKLAPR